MSATRKRSRHGSGKPIQALPQPRNARARRSISGTSRAFVPMRCRERPGASRVRRPSLRCRASARRSRPPPLVNSKGGFWFATYQGGMSAELFVAMLKLIMRGRRKPLYLLLDSLPAHKAKVVRDYEKATNGKLKLFFLPGYAPELNPDELVWSYVKRTGTAKRPLASNESLQDRIEADLINLQSNPGLIRSFFKAPDVAYITDS